jgi:hypothetical protein
MSDFQLVTIVQCCDFSPLQLILSSVPDCIGHAHLNVPKARVYFRHGMQNRVSAFFVIITCTVTPLEAPIKGFNDHLWKMHICVYYICDCVALLPIYTCTPTRNYCASHSFYGHAWYILFFFLFVLSGRYLIISCTWAEILETVA